MNYFLEINLPEQRPQIIAVKSKITLGSSSSSTLNYSSKKIAPLHCTFRLHNDVLTLHNSAGNLQTTLGKQALSHGKMYVLEKGDSLHIDNITINILDKNDESKFAKNVEKKDPVINMAETDSLTSQVDVESLIKEQKKQVTKYIKKEKSKTVLPLKKKSFKVSSKKIFFVNNKLNDYPAFFIRIYAFAVNLSLIYGVMFYLLPKIGQASLLTDLTIKTTPLINKLLTLFATYYPMKINSAYITVGLEIFLSYALIELSSTLIFGTSIPLFLSGVGGNGSFFANRIKGIIRSILHLLTFPFIIFDLPAILGKPTIKELISTSHLIYKNNFMKLFSTSILLPLLFYAGMAAPIANNRGLQEAIFEKIDSLIKNQTIAPTKTQTINFNFSITDGTIFFFSNAINIEDKNNLLVFKAQIPIQDPDQPATPKLSFIPNHALSIINLVDNTQKGNPLFRWSFPHLFEYYQVVTADPKSKIIFDQVMVEELKKMLQVGLDLEITLESFKQILLSDGPFINGFVNLKNILDSVIIYNKNKQK